MKQLLFFLPVIIIALVSCNHRTGSGNIVSEIRNPGNFNKVSVGGSFEVEVKKGNDTRVEVEADDNIIKFIVTRVEDNTLKIYMKDNFSFSNVHMKVMITAPLINSIKASGSAEVEVLDKLAGSGKLSFKASSSSSIKAEVDAPEIETDASSSATINLTGRTKSHKSEASSSADIRAFGLLSESVTARVSSSANIQVFASVNINARASSSGSIEYKGAAAVSKSESSSGSVEKKD